MEIVKPTCEQLWNEELEIVKETILSEWRHGNVLSVIYKRNADDTYWRATYRVSVDRDYNELREGSATIKQVVPVKVEIITYEPI
jgi:hypothetical protein